MGGDDRVPEEEDEVHEPKTPRVFSPMRILTGAAMGGGVCGLGAVAGGAASCAIVFKVFEPKNPTPEAAVSWPSGHQKSGRGAAARGGTPERAPRAGDPRRAAP